MNRKKTNPNGYTIVYLIVIIFIFSAMLLPIINLLALRMQVITSTISKEEALQIAEAGVNYYQWHLAHFPTDYQDGTGSAGPYVHEYRDSDTGKRIGQFSLEITPPDIGSTIVTIKSTGQADSNPNAKRIVTARYGIPSLAEYSFLSDDIIWIGNTETVTGEMHSNNGIRFDGTGNAPIKSAKESYLCSTNQGDPCPVIKDGVWGDAIQAVKNFWQFPVPVIDFSSLTADLAVMKSSAQSAGLYLPPSGANGYSLVFSDNSTVSVYTVDSLKTNPTGWDVTGRARNEYTDYDTRTLSSTQSLPGNGLIYVEDKVWVEGEINGRVLIAAATLPYNQATAPTIYLPNNLTYKDKDGTDILGLLAQKDILVTYDAPTNLEIDAALIAQNGSAQFLFYPGKVKDSITIYGSIMTYGQWTWSWVSGSTIVSGYVNTSSVYDNNLLYRPPPSFPFPNSAHQQIDWLSN